MSEELVKFRGLLPVAPAPLPKHSTGLLKRAVAVVGAVGGGIEDALVNTAIFAAVCVSLFVWMFVLPVWVFMTLRAVVMFGLLNVASVFRGREPVDPQFLERVVSMWPRGVRVLLGILSGHAGVSVVETEDVRRLVIETGLAIVFFTVLFFTTVGWR